MKTACLYTRKHSDGGRRERYLAATNMKRARTFAVIDGEKLHADLNENERHQACILLELASRKQDELLLKAS